MLPAYWSASCVMNPLSARREIRVVRWRRLQSPISLSSRLARSIIGRILARVMPLERKATLARMARGESETLPLDGHEVTISNPGKVFFADEGVTKIDLVRYYLAVADGALVGVLDRPMALKRFVDGADGEAFFQKRAPKSVPEFVRTVELSFPSGRTADEVVVDNAAALAWVVNLGCIDLNPDRKSTRLNSSHGY